MEAYIRSFTYEEEIHGNNGIYFIHGRTIWKRWRTWNDMYNAFLIRSYHFMERKQKNRRPAGKQKRLLNNITHAISMLILAQRKGFVNGKKD